MAITVNFPASSPFTLQEFADIVDFLAIDATVTSATPTGFTGVGTYNGAGASFTASGSGFTLGVISGITIVTGGTLDTVTFSTGGQTLSLTNMDINMAIFAPIIVADDLGVSPLGIENFLMAKDWNFTLSDNADTAIATDLVGDGAPFNLIGNDILRGMGGNDNLFLGDGNDRGYGGTGHDTLSGGLGRDLLSGQGGKDLLQGGLDNDRLLGGNGRDKLFGDGGNDKLDGGKGNDLLNGGDGKDRLFGGEGDDLLLGGGGADLFIFDDLSGSDRIRKFASKSNKEKIDLSDVTAIVDFNDLKANHMNQVGADVVIDDGTITITVENTLLGDMNKGDFLF